MNLEQEIGMLLDQAEPLRCLPDDEPAKIPLTAIVDAINKLRAQQAKVANPLPEPVLEGADADPEAEPFKAALAEQPQSLPARRPGRPRKSDAA